MSVDIYFNLDSKVDSIIESIESTNAVDLQFYEGDAVEANIYLTKEVDGVRKSFALKPDQRIVLAGAVADDAVTELSYLLYQDKFDLVYDIFGNECYKCLLDFATQPALDLLAETNSETFTFELVVIDKALGHQNTFQANATLLASLVKGTVKEVAQPSINFGSYSTVVSLASGIVDERILGLKDGAPVEFDTLYELAEYAQKVRSHEIMVGNYYDYLDGKRLADQNLTVVSLGNLAIDTSTYAVSHEPWRPIEVNAQIV